MAGKSVGDGGDQLQCDVPLPRASHRSNRVARANGVSSVTEGTIGKVDIGLAR